MPPFSRCHHPLVAQLWSLLSPNLYYVRPHHRPCTSPLAGRAHGALLAAPFAAGVAATYVTRVSGGQMHAMVLRAHAAGWARTGSGGCGVLDKVAVLSLIGVL